MVDVSAKDECVVYPAAPVTLKAAVMLYRCCIICDIRGGRCQLGSTQNDRMKMYWMLKVVGLCERSAPMRYNGSMVELPCNMIYYDKVSYTAWWREIWNRDLTINSPRTLHSSPSWASYEVSCEYFWRKISVMKRCDYVTFALIHWEVRCIIFRILCFVVVSVLI